MCRMHCRALRHQAMTREGQSLRRAPNRGSQSSGVQSFILRRSANRQGRYNLRPRLQALRKLATKVRHLGTVGKRRAPHAPPSLSHLPPPRPNPSLKPSPNSKAPGPRYSAGVLVLQRGPGTLLPVPA
jgi:hypothetical protein